MLVLPLAALEPGGEEHDCGCAVVPFLTAENLLRHRERLAGDEAERVLERGVMIEAAREAFDRVRENVRLVRIACASRRRELERELAVLGNRVQHEARDPEPGVQAVAELFGRDRLRVEEPARAALREELQAAVGELGPLERDDLLGRDRLSGQIIGRLGSDDVQHLSSCSATTPSP